MTARLPLWDTLRGPEGPARVDSDEGGGSRLTAAARQAARDLTRLQASRDAVASEVIAFQVARQRARFAAAADPDRDAIVVPLSTREIEVLRLVAAGRSDGEIADALFISKKTASVHVANIKGKLGAASRVEIAVVARRLGLVDDEGSGGEHVARPGSRTGATTAVICPFKGLSSFEAGDAAYFFGRERVVAELVARMVASTFVAIAGPSGSGKSSVVRAGLVPAVLAGVLPGSGTWPVVVMRPGAHPVAEMARARRLAGPGAVGDAVGDAAGDASPVHDATPGDATPGDPAGERSHNTVRAAPAGAAVPGRMVLVVDQFEEAFTLCLDPTERTAFFDQVADLAQDAGRRFVVVAAVRGDFYGRCSEHPALARLMSSSTMLLGPMAPDELARAIELPSRAAGLRLDPDLAPTLVADVLAQPGGLPLLSATLLDLWQRREGRQLRTASYRGVGGISGAVARLAEGAIGALTADDQRVARAILLRLTTTTETGAAVRRRATLAELDADRPEVAHVLAVLTERRLITVDEGEVDLSHEALLREWPRMRSWLEEDADGRRVRERLARAAHDWAAAGRDASELYRGPRLVATAEWAASHDGDLNDLERTFLADSRAAAEAVLAHQRRSNGRLRRLLVLTAGLLVVTIAAGAVAVRQAQTADEQAGLAARHATEAETARVDAVAARRDAEAAATAAQAGALVASSTAALTRDPTLARLLAVAAADVGPMDLDVEAALHASWQADPVSTRLTVDGDGIDGLRGRVDPAGRRMAAFLHLDAGTSEAPRAIREALRMVDLGTGVATWSYAPETPGVHMDPPFFTPDGSNVLVSLYWAPSAVPPGPPPAGLGVMVLDASTGAVVGRLDGGPCGTSVVAASSTWLVTTAARAGSEPACYAGDTGSAHELLDPATGERRPFVEDTLGDVVLSGDGRVAAYSRTPGSDPSASEAVMVEVPSGRVLSRVPFDQVTQQDRGFAALSADGSLALFGDRPVAVIETATGRVLATLGTGEGEHLGRVFAVEGDIAYTSGREGTLRTWDARKGFELFSLPQTGAGEVSATTDGRVLVSDFRQRTATLSHPLPLGEVATVHTCVGTLFPAGQLQVAGGTAVVGGVCGDQRPTFAFATDGWRRLTTMPDSDGQAIALSPDGTRVARMTSTVSSANPIEVDDVATGRRLVTLDGLCAWVPGIDPREDSPGCRTFPERPFPFWPQFLVYSRDGRMVVGQDSAGGIAAWNAGTGALLGTFEAPSTPTGIMLSPDGSELLVGTDRDGVLVVSTATWAVVRRAPATTSPEVGGRVRPIGPVDDGASLLASTGLGTLGSTWLHWLDPATLEVRRTMRLPESVKSLALNADGTLIATGSADGTVRVWDARDGTQLHRLGVDGQAQGVAFLPDGSLAITRQLGGILVETLDREALLATVRGSLSRTFTGEECAQFDLGPCPTLEELRAGPGARLSGSGVP